MTVRVEDTWQFQTARLRKLLAERAPGKVITFDEQHTTTVKFRVVDPVTGTELVPARGEWLPSELADKKTDDQLWNLVKQLSAGKL
jgi:hypothetical protein